jgi:ribonuclease R
MSLRLGARPRAVTRGNSVYFPDRVVPDAARRISTTCARLPGLDCPAIAVRMVIGPTTQARASVPSRAHSLLAASLRAAQAAIDGQPDDATEPLLPLVIAPLYAAYAALKGAR